jgi:SAM-dependent methyltransferase
VAEGPVRVGGPEMRVGSSGRVRAVEISERSLVKLVERITRAGLANVEPMLGAIADPHLESGAYDAVLVYNSYHEFTEHDSMLRHFFQALRPGGRLVMVDPIHVKNRDLQRHELVAIHEMSLAIVERDLTAAGLAVRSKDESFIRFTSTADPGGFWLLVATRPVAHQRGGQ